VDSGTPSRYRLEHERIEVFSVDLVPSAETADAIYDKIAACVADSKFRPRALLDRSNLAERVLPTFRPDALVHLDRPTWRNDIAQVRAVSGLDATTYDSFLDALRQRRAVEARRLRRGLAERAHATEAVETAADLAFHLPKQSYERR
jgi:glucuronate isomerase